MTVASSHRRLDIEQVPTGGPRRRELVAEWVIRADGVLIVARREDGAVLLVDQPGAGGSIGQWRLPGLRVREVETPLEAAISGLHAETGFRAARWVETGTTPASEAIRYPVHSFEARSVRFDPGPSAGDASAPTRWFDLDEAVKMTLDGRIGEPLSALQVLRTGAKES